MVSKPPGPLGVADLKEVTDAVPTTCWLCRLNDSSTNCKTLFIHMQDCVSNQLQKSESNQSHLQELLRQWHLLRIWVAIEVHHEAHNLHIALVQQVNKRLQQRMFV
jgi:hypothetical protein